MHFSRLVVVVAAALPAGACLLTAEPNAIGDDAATVRTDTIRTDTTRLPLLNGSYGADMKYCRDVKRGDWGIRNRVEKGLVSIKDGNIFWNEAYFDVASITTGSSGMTVHVKGDYEDIKDIEDDLHIRRIAKDRFVMDGTEYFFCTSKFPPGD